MAKNGQNSPKLAILKQNAQMSESLSQPSVHQMSIFFDEIVRNGPNFHIFKYEKDLMGTGGVVRDFKTMHLIF